MNVEAMLAALTADWDVELDSFSATPGRWRLQMALKNPRTIDELPIAVYHGTLHGVISRALAGDPPDHKKETW